MSNLDIYVHPGGHPPTRAHDSDAGLDLYTREHSIVYRSEPTKIPLGVNMAIPHGHVGLLVERSSAHEHGVGLANSVGVIDSGYRGELKASVICTGTRDVVTILKDTALVQLVIVPIALPTITMVGSPEYLGVTARQAGGFGSTDVKEY